jgi:hypothetical protein
MQIVNQIRSYGEDLTHQKNVEKNLRTLLAKFDAIVVVIEESKDLTHFSLNELMGSLPYHGKRMNKCTKKYLEQYFQAKDNISRDNIENSPPEEVLNTRG